MSKRIGERLVAQGLITPAQLDKALKAQLIMGGHLGTSLIELGFIDEEPLARTLAEMHRVRPALAEMLEEIPVEVIDSIPLQMAESYKVVPLSLDEETLHLAVIEPKSMPPISTVGVKKIVPWIAPEIRILQALEKYYGIPQRPRYLNICHELERGRAVARGPGSEAKHRYEAAAQAVTQFATHSLETPNKPVIATTMEIGEEYGYGKSWREIARGLFDDDDDRHQADDADLRSSRAGSPRTEAGSDLDVAALRMSGAQNKDQLGAAVLDFVAQGSEGSVLFSVRNEAARIWDWRGHGFSPDRVNGLRFPITSGSIFTLLLGNSHYLGPVPDESGCHWFFSALQIEVPQQIFLAPVHLNDRLVAILYADGGLEAEIHGDAGDFLGIARKLSLALNMLILQMKIRSA